MEKAGAKGGIVVDNNKGSTSANSPLFSMSGDGVDDVSIPMIFVFSNDAKPLFEAIQAQVKVEASLLDSSGKQCDAFSFSILHVFCVLKIVVVGKEMDFTSSTGQKPSLRTVGEIK